MSHEGGSSRIPSLKPRIGMLKATTEAAVGVAWDDSRRASRHARGYGTHWDRLRLVILKRDKYLCQCQECQGGALRVTEATEVDHLVSKAEWSVVHGTLEGVDHEGNLQAINHYCHLRKTQRDRIAAYGRSK